MHFSKDNSSHYTNPGNYLLFSPEKNSELNLPDYLEDIEKKAIIQALEKTNNNKTAAAKLLGVSFRTLRYRLSKLGLAKDGDLDIEIDDV